MLQTLPYLWNMKTLAVLFFYFFASILYFSPVDIEHGVLSILGWVISLSINRLFLRSVVRIVYEPITDHIGYRRRYGLFADISVLPISKMLIGIGYRYRPIRTPISVTFPIC